MSWGAQNRSKDAKTPSASRGMSENPNLELCGIQPYSWLHGYSGANLAGIRHMLQVSIRVPVEEQQPFKKYMKEVLLSA
jgi:hypothetical protein